MKEITIKELAKRYNMSGSAINAWITKSGVKPIRRENTGTGIPTNIYSAEEIEKADITKYSNRRKFKEQEEKAKLVEIICSELGIKRSQDKTDKELSEDAIIDLLCRIDENTARIAEAVETLAKAWK